jgi:tetratricopeptide (TPR) repeat protein
MGAIKTYDESRKVFKSLKDNEGIGYCLCGLGGASRIAGRFRTSLRYYTSANKLFFGTGNTFGRAYSYCGIGNAHRMLNDYKNAFRFFSKATGLYRKIGDRVSYAYTLWGLATAYKMIGSYGQARDHLMNALELFKKTKDPRGIIYCSLGFSEIALLQGNRAVALRYLSHSEGHSAEYDFTLEQCYAGTLRSFLLQPDAPSLIKQNMKGAGSGNIGESCYNRLGLKLRFKKLPLNIP